MITAKIIWVQSPYRAGFGITDDTDAATFEQVKVVYDFLSEKRFLTTKTVWAYTPIEKCGIPPTPDSTLRGVTLQDARYLLYCKKLYESGYEICLHGASAGNNQSKSTLCAMQLLESQIGASDTFICHSKNAENIYWNEKITSFFPFRQILRIMNSFKCSGEATDSPYFWGDICAAHINNIRLLRTRHFNTLKSNPSMPYFSPSKPYVNGWFSATKRAIADYATDENLEQMIQENGLTILYQYLHRYADPENFTLQPKFVAAIEKIAAKQEIKTDTVSNHLKRLRLIQGIFVLYRDKQFWLVNTNNDAVYRLQIDLSEMTAIKSADCTVQTNGRTMTIRELPAQSVTRFDCEKPVLFEGKNCIGVNRAGKFKHVFREGSLYVNLSPSAWKIKHNLHLEHGTFHIEARKSGTGNLQLSYIPFGEEFRLLCGQFWIVAREILFKGRSLNADKYLDATREILLENHDNW